LLTDYHVHLRPDSRENTAERFFTAANAERYREMASERGITELGVSEHVYRFSAALEIWQHPFWRRYASDDLDAYCAFVREETDLRLGIEMDFVPGREDRIANVLDGRDWDYVVGSVHFLRDHAVDAEDYSVWESGQSPEKVWRHYFETLAEAAGTGLYDIMSHPDLVKVWDSGVAVELSTAGWRKPVGEQYPSLPFLEMVVDAGCPIALSSDAHEPEQLGFEYERAVELLHDAGVREIAVFERRERRLEPLG
jgi:histidinol-phosphatase (PHP family)